MSRKDYEDIELEYFYAEEEFLVSEKELERRENLSFEEYFDILEPEYIETRLIL